MTTSGNSGVPPFGQPSQAADDRPQQAAASWPSWIAQVQHALRMQQEQMRMLQSRVDMLSAQLKAAEAKPSYSIDKIEYHFDQLKIEKLDGTLNIGIQPPSDGSESDIDQLIVQHAKNGHGTAFTGSGNGNGNGIGSGDGGSDANNNKPNVFPSAGPAATSLPPPFDNIQRRVNAYMDQQAPEALVAMEREIGLPLDPYHRRIVIEDIRRQLPTRIQFYMQQSKANNPDSDTQPFTVEEQVTNKTIRDVQMAFRQYLTKLTSNGSGAEGGGVLQV